MIAKRRIREFFLLSMAMVLLGVGAPSVGALELDETDLFFELNDTDGDLGIHASIDGGPYTALEIENPRGQTIFHVRGSGGLRKQGLTQLFVESAEPTFDELSPERFFRRFREGTYEIKATRRGERFEAEVELSHVMAAPASNIMINDVPAAENCDADPLPSVSAPVVIDWDPVTESHPEIGESGPVEIDRYQFFVEQGDIDIAVTLPPTLTGFEVPAELLAAGGVFKFEIIARTTDLNNTAVESCFVLE
jgi:hypothetical protein